MSNFPKLRAYIDRISGSDEVDQMKISGYMLSEAPEGAKGAAYVTAIELVNSWVVPLKVCLEFGDPSDIERAKSSINSAIDDLYMVCRTTPDAGIQ
jgi:hypothetical protein